MGQSTGWERRRLADGALAIGAAGLLVGALLMRAFPQMPAGDETARALFAARHGGGGWHQVAGAAWWHGAGALAAWGALARLLAARRGWARLFWIGLLLAWAGWAWNQTRGWQGELFLTPPQRIPLGPDGVPALTVERFLRPPAPDGPGRALAMRLRVADQPVTVAAGDPWRGAGWTLAPHWYGVTVEGPALAAPP